MQFYRSYPQEKIYRHPPYSKNKNISEYLSAQTKKLPFQYPPIYPKPKQRQKFPFQFYPSPKKSSYLQPFIRNNQSYNLNISDYNKKQQNIQEQMFEIHSHFEENRSQGFFREEIDIMVKEGTIQCGICNQFFLDEEMKCLGQCGHLFCATCLKYYVMHKLKHQFSDIECPREGCTSTIHTEGEIYNSLPVQLQKRYFKIKENLHAIKCRSHKLCPDCGEKLSSLKSQNNLLCEKCLTKYCPTCMNKAHPKFARCEAQVIRLLKRDFRYKQCKQCLFMVERIEGCNHMTCTCGYEFCYNCGGYWNHGMHECPPPPKRIRPLSYKVIKKEIPVRQAFNLAAVNILFNPEQALGNRPKGSKVVKYDFLPSLARNSRIRNNRKYTENNSLVINNQPQNIE